MAFLKAPDVLLFDEAILALERVAGHKTVIAVAHRLSTLKDFNRIVVMKDGRKI